MNDGWYRVTRKEGLQYVVEVAEGRCELGRISKLQEQGCTVEPVQVLTQPELEHLITSAYQAGAKRTQELLGIPQMPMRR